MVNFSGGATASCDSQLRCYGRIQFTATRGNGGAMALYGTSNVVLNPLTEVDFLENHASLMVEQYILRNLIAM